MKKTNENKINWKKVAIIGGMFVLGVAAGSIGEMQRLEGYSNLKLFYWM